MEAVLFDLDGVLQNNVEAISHATLFAINAHSIYVSPEQIRPYLHSLAAAHEKFAPKIPYESVVNVYDQLIEWWRWPIEAYDGAAAVLKDVHSDYKTGLVSNSRKAQEALEKLNLSDHFDVVVTGLDVEPEEHKPHPKTVKLALEALGCTPQQAVLIGDQEADMIAGSKAGVNALIGITHGIGTEAELRAYGARYIIHSLMELPPTLEKIKVSRV